MRAITAREHRKALAERRQAQADFAERTRPAPSQVGWSSKPEPKSKRKPSESDMRVAADADAQRAGWRQHHPDVAAAERQLRKQRAGIAKRWDHKADGTPETHEHASRQRQGAIARLFQTGAIDAVQLGSAVAIAGVVERIGAEVTVRTASLETRVDVTRVGDGTFYEALSHVRHEVAYSRWRRRLGPSVQPVLEMIVNDDGVTVVAKRWRMHVRRAKKLLLDALDAWPGAFAEARQEIDAATLAAAHAGIL